MEKKRVGIAMSGGVDSTCCALLLKARYEITGFFMLLAQPDMTGQRKQAEDIAARIGIDLYVVDLRRHFDEKILAYFTKSYADGLTPNPCMRCNHEIKFGLFMQSMLQAGMDAMATGHYVRVREQDGVYHLYKGIDPHKDQSYFLARLTQNQLARTIFPLGEMTKHETYRMAEKHGFVGFHGLESQDVCFFDKESLGEFLAARLRSEPGPIVARDGRVLGNHQGLFQYTVGQRRGLGISDATPWYVVDLDSSGNRLIVGKEQDLYRDRVELSNVHWLTGKPPVTGSGLVVKIRSTHPGAEAAVELLGDARCLITFKNRQRAVTPGQFVVIYRDDEVIGSGEILKEQNTQTNADGQPVA